MRHPENSPQIPALLTILLKASAKVVNILFPPLANPEIYTVFTVLITWSKRPIIISQYSLLLTSLTLFRPIP